MVAGVMHLLPPNSTSAERALSLATARVGEVPVPVGKLWSPWECPVEVLPWLAWALSVEPWEAGWSEQQKRASIAASIGVHRHKGTIGALKRALQALGYEVDVNEQTGEAYVFRITVNSSSQPITPEVIASARDIALKNKNARSMLDRVDAALKSLGAVFVGACACVGICAEMNPPDGDAMLYDDGNLILWGDGSPVYF